MRLYFTIYKGDGAQTRPLAILGVRVALPSCVRFEWAIFPSILRALDTSKFQKSNDGMKWYSSKNRWVDSIIWPIKLCRVKWTDFEHQKGLRGGEPTYIPISAHGKKKETWFFQQMEGSCSKYSGCIVFLSLLNVVQILVFKISPYQGVGKVLSQIPKNTPSFLCRKKYERMTIWTDIWRLHNER